MKHGIAFRKFSRTSSHRMLMLRNLVTSLFEHEQIKTTLPKARDTARLAEKIITMGKKGDIPSFRRASAFLLKPSVLPKLFGTFADRYSDRPGGYTRIHKFGNRPGDNAPHAILELVDNPRDLRYEITSRAIGWELLKDKLQSNEPVALINRGVDGAQELVEKERGLAFQDKGLLRPKTRWNLQKVLRFRDSGAALDISKKAGEYADHLLASPVAFKTLRDERLSHIKAPKRVHARVTHLKVGQMMLGETQGALKLVQGDLGQSKPPSKLSIPLLTPSRIFGRRYKDT